MVESSSQWTQMAPLPPPWDTGTHGIVGVTMDNVALLLGGAAGQYVDRVVQYDREQQRWVGVEQNINMTRARYLHAVSVVDINILSNLCLL